MTVLAAHSEAVRLTSPGTQRRRISVLGATGSIGENTLDLVGRDTGVEERLQRVSDVVLSDCQ